MDVAAALTTMSFREPKVAKTVFIHRNGATKENPKRMVVNERHVRDFSTFLNRVTSGLKAPVAVRNIYTPVGGHRVQALSDLETGKHYVAGGVEHFKKSKYQQVFTTPTRRVGKPEISITRPPIVAIETKSRVRDLPEKPFVIHVFRNGDALFRGVRVLLPRRVMSSWEQVLEIITEKTDLYTPAKKLCTLEGVMLHTIADIKDGEKYVAVEGNRQFRKLPYSAIDPTSFNTRPRQRYQRARMMLAPGIVAHKRVQAHHTTNVVEQSSATSESQKQPSPRIKTLMPLKSYHGKTRPFAGRKDKEARNKAVLDAREDSIFGGSPPAQDNAAPEEEDKKVTATFSKKQPTRSSHSEAKKEKIETDQASSTPPPPPQQQQADVSTSQQEKPTFIEADDEHDGEQQQLNDASTVNENIEDQNVELKATVDLEEAREVVEEVVVEEKETQGDEEEIKERGESELIELQAQQQTSIDLSVKRVETEDEEDSRAAAHQQHAVGSDDAQSNGMTTQPDNQRHTPTHSAGLVTTTTPSPVTTTDPVDTAGSNTGTPRVMTPQITTSDNTGDATDQLHNPSHSSIKSHTSNVSQTSQRSKKSTQSRSGAVSKASSSTSKKQFIH